jgi:hypothetical protein
MADNDTDYAYSLGTIGDPPSFNLLIEITATEYEDLANSIRAVAGLETPFIYKLVERNFLGMEEIYQFVGITISLGRQFTQPDHRQLAEALMSSTVNWLASMRLFLDHTETALKRRFGKSSPEVNRFKLATNSAYDEKVGYRFSYQFRNYVQHCGLPFSTIRVGKPDKAARTRARQSVELLLDRDTLLREYDEWRHVKRDLEAMPSKFPLLPLASEAMEGLRDIYRELLDIRLSEALSDIQTLVRALDRVEATGDSGHPALFRYRGDFSGPSEITPTILRPEAIRQLAEVADGSVTRDSLFMTEVQQPPRFDPATVRQRFHRDNRGVQVLSTWLAEKGASPGFVDSINTIISEDQSIEPLVTGLIQVSVLFAHMAAASLGATTEGFVAGLLDVYGQFDQPTDGDEPT